MRTAMLDEILKIPLAPIREFIEDYETAPLKYARMLVKDKNLKKLTEFAEITSDSVIWKMVTEQALFDMDFTTASLGFARSQNHNGIEFLKRLAKFNDIETQRAEIFAFCDRIDVAEKLYLDMDRKDLALDLRIRACDWFRVVQLIKSGGGGNDLQLEAAWNKIGDNYFERQQ